MLDRKRFTFKGDEFYLETNMGFKVNLGETPSLQCLQGLFEDLFLQRRANSEYLFVSKHDIETLTNDVLRNTHFCEPGVDFHGNSAVVQGTNYACMVTKIVNQVTGQLVHLVPLPGLEQHSIIIGFFK